MKKNVIKIWIWMFLFSLFVIFFVWFEKNKDTNTQKIILTQNWLTHFKKWLDLAWWVRLTYKIDYSKYKESYKNPLEFSNMKKKAEEIIKKNIDNRISKLWVSDYNSFIQVIDNENFLVIEIGWLSDIQEAKDKIWKTVELEFKIPNQLSWDSFDQSRKPIVESLFESAKKDITKFSQIWTWRQSEEVYYVNYSWVSLSELPELYQKNIKEIEASWAWVLYNKILSWDYASIPTTDANWWVTINTLKWWSIVKYNWKKRVELSQIDQLKFEGIIETLWLKFTRTYTKENINIKDGEYNIDENQKSIIYNGWEIYSWKDAYEVLLYKVEKPDLLWKTTEQASQIKQSNQQIVTKLQEDLKSWTEWTYTWVTKVYTGWLDNDSLLSYIKDFKPFTWESTKSYETLDWTFVLKILSSKQSWEKLIKVVKVADIKKLSKQQILDALKYDFIYNIEDIFVRNAQGWVTAKDPKTWEILNGAYFRFAAVDNWKLWLPVVTINFDDKWKEIFCNLTEANIWKQMAIFVWWKLVTNPTIREKICAWTAQIDWNFTPETAKQTTTDLNEWALPAKLILSHEDKLSPLLWNNAITGAIIAWIVAFVLIFILMVIMYWTTMWTISLISLILFVTILFAIIKILTVFFGFVLSLSWIAAIILSVWMWVDANILFFERVNEEQKNWKTKDLSIREWYHRSMSAIIDWNLTTLMIALLLFFVWTNVFKWFWTMTIINILLTLFVIARSSRDIMMYYYNNK